MTPRDKRKIPVFIASPGDLKSERAQFREAIDQLNMGFGDGANIEFEAIGWEDAHAITGRRAQGVINEDVDRCEVFFLIMHRRWGQPVPDSLEYSSYTEEEFHRAFDRWKQEKKPEIFIFFKQVEAAQEADAGPQLQKVIRFRRQIQESGHILYKKIDGSDNAFLSQVDSHLRDYAKGQLPEINPGKNVVILPLKALDAVNKGLEEARSQTKRAEEENDELKATALKLEELQLQAAEDAAAFAKQGLLERARQKFVQLISETSDIRILRLAHEFFENTGDLNTTSVVLNQWLTLTGPEAESSETADALAHLGNLFMTSGDLGAAASHFEKALAVNRDLENMDGLADVYQYLGMLYQTKGELTLAESHFERSLMMEEIRENAKGIAKGNRNLGNLSFIRGNLKKAANHYEKSLELNRSLDYRKGMAFDYGNLANLHLTHRQWDQAKEMYEKSLKLNRSLGNKKGMALQLNNLGLLHQRQDDFDMAEKMYQKALALDLEIGHKEGIAGDYGSLGNLAVARDDLQRAEAMFEKALKLNQELGHKSGMAADFSDLGLLHQKRGELERAQAFFKKSLALNKAVGSTDGEAGQWGNLASVHEDRGEYPEAKDMYEKALLLYEKLGYPNAEKVREALVKLKEKAEQV